MTRERVQLGRSGEELVSSLLTRADWEILDRNVRLPHGEIDLIAREGDTLVFLEVKTLRLGPDRMGPGPAQAILQVGPRKQRRIRQLAAEWLAAGSIPRGIAEFRFDVVGVEFDSTDPLATPRIEHIRGAFDGRSGG